MIPTEKVIAVFNQLRGENVENINKMTKVQQEKFIEFLTFLHTIGHVTEETLEELLVF